MALAGGVVMWLGWLTGLLSGCLAEVGCLFGILFSSQHLGSNHATLMQIDKIYTQYPIIRNGVIRNSAEFLGKFKKRALGRPNLRNASKNFRNGQCSDF